MALSERLALIIDARAGGAVSEFKMLGKEAEALGKTQQKAASAVNGLLASSGQSARVNLAPVGKLEGALASVGLGGVQAGALVKTGLGIAAAAGVGLLTKAVGDSVEKFATLTGEVRGLQTLTGASARDASLLSAALHAVGIDAETAGAGLGTLSKNIENAPEKLAKLGIQIAKNSDGSTNLSATLLNVADAFNATEDHATRNTIALTAFGRGGLDLLPILARGREGIDALFKSAADHGLLFSDEDLQRGKELAAASKDLHEVFEGLEIQLARGIVPLLTKATSATTTLVDAARKGADIHIGKDQEGFLSRVGKGLVGRVIPGGEQLLNLLGGTKHAADDAADSLNGLTGALNDTAVAEQETVDGATKLVSTFLAARNADRSYADAKRGVGEAEQRVADSRSRLNDLMAKAVVDTKKVADAERNLEDAARGVEDAQRSVTDALRGVAEAEANLAKVRQGASPRDLAGAGLDLRSAQLAKEQAERGLTSATDRLVQVQILRPQEPWAYADALLGVESAQLDLERATAGITDAQDRLNEVQNYGKEGSESLNDAQRQLEDAQRSAQDAVRGLESATRNQADAQDALNAAQRVDPALSGQIQAAKRDLADAERGVGDAKWRVTEAAWASVTAHQNEATALSGAGDSVGYLRDQLWSLIDTYPELAPLLGALGGFTGPPTAKGANFIGGYQSTGSLGSRASGGSVWAGDWLIGERGNGAEHMHLNPGSSGTVANATNTAQMFSGGAPRTGGNTYITNIYMPPGSSGADVVDKLKQFERRNGPGWRSN